MRSHEITVNIAETGGSAKSKDLPPIVEAGLCVELCNLECLKLQLEQPLFQSGRCLIGKADDLKRRIRRVLYGSLRRIEGAAGHSTKLIHEPFGRCHETTIGDRCCSATLMIGGGLRI